MKYIRNDQILVNDTPEGEKMMFDSEAGKYYALNRVAASIWDGLDSAKTEQDIVRYIIDIFDVEMEQCVEHIRLLLQDGLNKKLFFSVADDK